MSWKDDLLIVPVSAKDDEAHCLGTANRRSAENVEVRDESPHARLRDAGSLEPSGPKGEVVGSGIAVCRLTCWYLMGSTECGDYCHVRRSDSISSISPFTPGEAEIAAPIRWLPA